MSKFKVGDSIKAIKTSEGNFITKDKVYKVLDFREANREGVYLVEIIGDSGSEVEVFEDRFTLVKTENEVNYIILPNSINLAFDGKVETINTGHHSYKQILDAIREDRLQDIPDILDVNRAFKSVKNMEVRNGRLYVLNKLAPEIISDRVLKFKAQGLPFEPLIKFTEKLMKNPSFNSRQMLYKFLEHNGHPITKNGTFIAYKKVDKNFKDCYTNTMDNSVGTTVEMPREEVDDNPENTCSSGLHVAAYNYARNFSSGHLVEVEIDPEDVVAVPNDYNGEKMRVCKYRVIKVCESKLDVDLYEENEDYSSDYDVDEDWEYYV